MSDAVGIYQQLNNDPDFKALPYAKQMEIRAQLLSKHLPNDADYAALAPDAQQRVFRGLVTAAPSFSQETDFTRTVTDLTSRMRNGDDAARAEAVNLMTSINIFDNAGPIFDVARAIAGALPDGETTAEVRQALGGPRRKTEDEIKATQYLQQQVTEDQNVSGLGRAILTLSPIVGIVGNIASGRVAMQAPLTAIRGTGAVRGANQIVQSEITGSLSATLGARATTSVGRWLTASALPEIAESGLDAAMMLIGDLQQNTVESKMPDWMPRLESRLGNAALSFGANFAGDMLVFTALSLTGSLIQNVARTARIRRGFAGAEHALENIPDNVSDEMWQAIQMDVFSGRRMSKAQFNSLPKSTQREVLAQRRRWEMLDRVGNLTGEERAQLVAAAKNAEIVQTGQTWTLYKNGQRIGDGFSSADRALAALYKHDMAPGLSDAAKIDAERMRGRGYNVEQVTRVEIDEAAPPVRAVGDDVALAEDAAKVRNYDPAILQDAAKRLEIPISRSGSGWDMGGVHYGSTRDALDALGYQYYHRLALEPEAFPEISNALSKQFGVHLIQKDGIVRAQIHGTSDILYSGPSTSDVLTEMFARGYKPKLPQKYGPKLVIDNAAKTIEVREGVLTGPPTHIHEVPSSFFDDTMTEGQLMQRFGSNTIKRDSIRTTYRVTLDDAGVVAEDFASFEEAKAFIRKDIRTIEDLRNRALYKGVVDIEVSGDRITTRAIDEDGLRVHNSLDEAQAYINEKVAPAHWRQEISNMDPSVIDQAIESLPVEQRKLYGDPPFVTKPRINNFEEHIQTRWHKIDPDGETDFRGALQRAFGTFGEMATSAKYQTINQLTGQTGFQVIKDTYQTMQKQIQNSRGTMARLQQVVEASQRVAGVDKARRIVLRPLLEVDPAQWDAAAAALKIPDFKTADTVYLERTRAAFNQLGSMFGIDPHKMWTNYLPRMREYIDAHPGIDASTGLGSEVIREIFGGSMPKELQFFAENLRSRDVVRWVKEADSRDMLMRYTMSGAKNMTLARGFKQIVSTLDEAFKAGRLNTRTMHTLTDYLQDVMGMYTDQASRLALQTTQDMTDTLTSALRGLGKDRGNKEAMRDMISVFHSFTIAATMSFKPWLPIRNMQQIWLTLAPRVGNHRVMNALRRMRDPKVVGERAQRLRESGRLMNQNPMFELSGIIYQESIKGWKGLGQRLNQLGMAPYKNSDEYTRIVVDFVTEDLFQDAAIKLQNGAISERQFLKMSGLSKLDEADQRDITRMLMTQGYSSALDRYADVLTDETMFPYSHGSNPALFRGFLGRLFGMFGHYPVYFAQNLRNGLLRGSAADRLAFAGRVVANSAALWFTFEKVFGVKADQFLPHKTLFFSGGPYYKLMGNALSAMAGEPGAPSMTQVLREAGRVLIPGSSHMRGFERGVQALQRGHAYEAWLHFMAVPAAETD